MQHIYDYTKSSKAICVILTSEEGIVEWLEKREECVTTLLCSWEGKGLTREDVEVARTDSKIKVSLIVLNYDAEMKIKVSDIATLQNLTVLYANNEGMALRIFQGDKPSWLKTKQE